MPSTASSSVMSALLPLSIPPGQPLEHPEGVLGGAYVVHPQAPHTLLREQHGERGVGVLAIPDRTRCPAGGEERTEERLAARTHQDRVPEVLQRSEVADQLPVVLRALGEAEAGVEH